VYNPLKSNFKLAQAVRQRDERLLQKVPAFSGAVGWKVVPGRKGEGEKRGGVVASGISIRCCGRYARGAAEARELESTVSFAPLALPSRCSMDLLPPLPLLCSSASAIVGTKCR
jgi:hypothetical protein